MKHKQAAKQLVHGVIEEAVAFWIWGTAYRIMRDYYIQEKYDETIVKVFGIPVYRSYTRRKK
jgi:hypothetical protein